MSKLERLAKNATQGGGSGMSDAVQKTEAIRNWVSFYFCWLLINTPKADY
jgi:hypothetical protein